MEIRVAPERVFVLTPSVTWDAAKEKAWGQKASVFGALSNLVFRPAADDVQISKSELRFSRSGTSPARASWSTRSRRHSPSR